MVEQKPIEKFFFLEHPFDQIVYFLGTGATTKDNVLAIFNPGEDPPEVIVLNAVAGSDFEMVHGQLDERGKNLVGVIGHILVFLEVQLAKDFFFIINILGFDVFNHDNLQIILVP